MNEHSFVKSIHRKLPSNLYRWKICDAFAGGVPDAMYAGPAGILFVEYKYLKTLPKKSKTAVKIDLSKLQLAWLVQMMNFGHSCNVVVGHEGRALILSEPAQLTSPVNSAYYQKNSIPINDLIDHIVTSVLPV